MIFFCILRCQILQKEVRAAFQYLRGAIGNLGRVVECGDRTSGKSFKATESRFRLNIRRRYKSLLRGEALAQAAPFLVVLKARLDGAGMLGGVPAHGREVWMVFKVPYNSNHSVILY